MTSHVLFEEQTEPGLYLVHPKTDHEAWACDIFILHGLNGSPTRTWQHPETSCIWFRDFLPSYLKSQLQQSYARIWTYGYNASTTFNTQDVYGHATTLLSRVNTVRRGHEGRKIIWICHSLGGIVVKSALIEAGIHPDFKDIQRSTTGVIFLGTPHRGSGAATLGQIAAAIASAATPGFQILNRRMLRDLERDNDNLFQTSNRFSSICTQMTIRSFYENLPMYGSRVIVEKTSAILSITNEVSIGLNLNHKDMCKFKHASDQNWIPLRDSIVELVGQAVTRYQPQGTQSRRYDYWPPTPASNQPPGLARVPVGRYNERPPTTNWNTYNQGPPSIPTMHMPPYPDRTYNSSNGPQANPRPRASSGHVPPGNPQSIPYRPRTQHDPQNTASTSNPYLQPPSFSSNELPAQFASGRVEAIPVELPTRPAERRPYPTVNPAFSREDLSSDYIPVRTRSVPPRTDDQTVQPNSRPGASMSSQPPQRQVSDVGPSTAHHPETVGDEESQEEAALCDGCMNSIRCSQPRVKCTECYDYDLCIPCFQLGRTSKQHKSNHKVSHILSSQLIKPQDLIPPRDVVNPEWNPEQTKRNWSVRTTTSTTDGNEELQDWRMIHLHGNDSHARFLTSAKPGHFGLSLYFQIEISDLLSTEDRKALETEGVGWLRVSFGTLHNKKDFVADRLREETFDSMALTEDSMIQKLLKESWYDVVQIPVNQSIIEIQSDVVLSVEGHQGCNTDLGLIVQWSGVRAFQAENDALVKLSVIYIKLDDLLDYQEPLVRFPPPNAPKRAPESSSVSQQTTAVTATDENDNITVGEFIMAVAQAQREIQDEQDRRLLQAIIRQRLEEQEQKQKAELVRQLFLLGLYGR
ncbi:hypothetical protein BP6252_13221 [Coleophoma cylindrospora]|uniref:ZZ-type domain-containing protein n=1 Tax=Coleophoma cylindrospora TaxID=1849047 RepID=A0A3D8QA80_9HELO|nr:hypothetical protein BP6252_13221 [Coleophoma cylindrospora]